MPALTRRSLVWMIPVALVACEGGAVEDDADASRDAATALDASVPEDAGDDAGDGSADGGGAPTARLVFVGDFEAEGGFERGGTYSQFSENIDTCEHDETCDTDSMEIVTSPVRSGARALRITLRAGDVQDTGGTRAELQTGSHYEHSLEEDYWYGWSIFVPPDWVDGDDQKVVHQWHTGSDSPGGSPIIGLRIRAGDWQITRELTEGDAVELWRSDGVPRGEWVDWVMHVRWSPTDTGHFTAWMNGTIVHTEDGPNMHPDTTLGGHYQKLGMYGPMTDAITERVLYYDEVRVAIGEDGYDLVAPR